LVSPPDRHHTQDRSPIWSTTVFPSPFPTLGAVVSSGRCRNYISTDSGGCLQDFVDDNHLIGSSRALPAVSVALCPFSNFDDEVPAPHIFPLRRHVSGGAVRLVDLMCAQEVGSVSSRSRSSRRADGASPA